MASKLWFVGGLAAGYVLGTRAGRERFDQISSTVRKALDDPAVKDVVDTVQTQANRLYEDGRTVVADKLGTTKIGRKLTDQRSTVVEPEFGTVN